MILVGTFCVRFTRSAAADPFNTFIIKLRGPVGWWVCVCNVHALVDQTVNQSFQLISSTKFPNTIRFHLPASSQQIEKYNFVFCFPSKVHVSLLCFSAVIRQRINSMRPAHVRSVAYSVGRWITKLNRFWKIMRIWQFGFEVAEHNLLFCAIMNERERARARGGDGRAGNRGKHAANIQTH